MKQVSFSQHRNWLLTIMQVNLPFIFWGTCILLFLVMIPAFLLRPVYSAQGILTLDSDLGKVLRGVDTQYSTTVQADFIRYEYFATHTLSLLRLPQLGAHVTSLWDVRDLWGHKLQPEYFTEPGKFRLLTLNNGQGVRAEWIADTQQFSITGYSKDPDRAAGYATEYIHAFLDQNTSQFRDILSTIEARLKELRNTTSSRIKEINEKIQQVKLEHHAGDPSNEIEALNSRISTLKASIDDNLLAQKVYQVKMDQLTKEAKDFEKLRTIERTIQTNPVISILKTQIETLSESLAEASVEYTPEHPEYKRVQKKLTNAKDTLKKEALKSFGQESAKTSSALDKAFEKMLDLAVDKIAYAKTLEHLKATVATYQARIDELIKVDAETTVLGKERDNLFDALTTADRNRFVIHGLQNGTIPFFRVVSPVQMNKDNLNYYKYFPKKKTILLWATVLSLVLLSFLVLGKELQANSLYLGWQVSAVRNDMNYADVPELGGMKWDGGGAETLICNYIRNICLAVRDSDIVRITSREANEGKATISRAVAWYYHKLGKSVVIVDGDVSCQSVTRTFKPDYDHAVEHDAGNGKTVKEIIIRDQVSGISLIPGSQWSSYAHDKGYVPPVRDLIAALTSDFDKVIFVDSPLSDDCLMLADNLPRHDMILVLRSGAHSVYEVESVDDVDRLTKGQTVLKGVIVNRIPCEANMLTLQGLRDLFVYMMRKPVELFARK